MRVVSASTPAQYFHALRRQAHARPERPLVLMFPKSLLRHPMATSPVSDLIDGNFQQVLDDPTDLDCEVVTRLVLCSGKLFYDLIGSELREGASDLAIARLEELYPFPGDELKSLLSRYPALKEVVWAQEEPRNMGAVAYVGPRLRNVVPREVKLSHVARPERASPAEGKNIGHVVEQARVVREVLNPA